MSAEIERALRRLYNTCRGTFVVYISISAINVKYVCRKFQTMRLASEYATRHMLSNGMLKEYPVTQANMSKVSKVNVSISYSMGQKVSWGI